MDAKELALAAYARIKAAAYADDADPDELRPSPLRRALRDGLDGARYAGLAGLGLGAGAGLLAHTTGALNKTDTNPFIGLLATLIAAGAGGAGGALAGGLGGAVKGIKSPY